MKYNKVENKEKYIRAIKAFVNNYTDGYTKLYSISLEDDRIIIYNKNKFILLALIGKNYNIAKNKDYIQDFLKRKEDADFFEWCNYNVNFTIGLHASEDDVDKFFKFAKKYNKTVESEHEYFNS